MSCSPVRASALCGWLDCSGVGEGEAARFCELVMYSSYRRRRSTSLYHVTYLPGGFLELADYRESLGYETLACAALNTLQLSRAQGAQHGIQSVE